MREREGGRGGGTRPEKTAGATHPKTTQRQPEAAQLNAYAKLKAIRSRKRAPGWAERAFAMFKKRKKNKISPKAGKKARAGSLASLSRARTAIMPVCNTH